MSRKLTKTRFPGVYRHENGGWWIEARQRTTAGNRVVRRRTLPATLAIEEAVRERALLVTQLTAEIDTNAHPTTTSSEPQSTTVADFAEQWIELKTKRLRRSVAEHYADVLGRFVLPVLGTRLVNDISRHDVEEWVGWAEARKTRSNRPYARDTLRSWWRVVATFLRDAAAKFGFPDPTYRVLPPDSTVRGVREGITLTGPEVGLLLQAVGEHYPKWLAEVTLLAFSGLRPGELYALRFDDVDEAAGVIHVRRSVRRRHESLTKTDDPRDVGLTEELRSLIRDHRARLLREQHPGLSTGLMFPAKTGGHRGPEALLNMMRLAGKAAGVSTRVGSQVIRRTFNTLALEAGADQTVLRKQMGHASSRMTSRYAGVHPEAKRELVEAVQKAVGTPPGTPASEPGTPASADGTPTDDDQEQNGT